MHTHWFRLVDVAASSQRNRPESPLTASVNAPSQPNPCILHPPLPSSTVGGTQVVGTVPILLNPDIMQGTTIPIISPQVRATHRKVRICNGKQWFLMVNNDALWSTLFQLKFRAKYCLGCQWCIISHCWVLEWYSIVIVTLNTWYLNMLFHHCIVCLQNTPERKAEVTAESPWSAYHRVKSDTYTCKNRNLTVHMSVLLCDSTYWHTQTHTHTHRETITHSHTCAVTLTAATHLSTQHPGQLQNQHYA